MLLSLKEAAKQSDFSADAIRWHGQRNNVQLTLGVNRVNRKKYFISEEELKRFQAFYKKHGRRYKRKETTAVPTICPRCGRQHQIHYSKGQSPPTWIIRKYCAACETSVKQITDLYAEEMNGLYA